MRALLTIIILSVTVAFSSALHARTNTIVMWIQDEAGARAFRELAIPYTQLTGIDVQVRVVDDIVKEMNENYSAENYPDIVLWANDRIHSWVQKKLITFVHPSQAVYDSILNISWGYVTKKNKFYGYPLNIECVSLLYNKALVPRPPTNFEDIVHLQPALEKKQTYPIVWDYNNAYFSWALLAANGGYIYKSSLGFVDPNDTGVNHPKMVEAAQYMQSLLAGNTLPKDMDYNRAVEMFSSGKAAMIIQGPWIWQTFDQLDMHYGVATLPKYKGVTAKPMVGAKTLMVSRDTKRFDEVKILIENHFLTENGFKKINEALNLAVLSHKRLLKKDLEKPRINATFQNCLQGHPMPDIPEMANFWDEINTALPQIFTENKAPKAVLDHAAQRILERNKHP